MHGSVLGFFAYGALQAREVAGRQVLEVGAADVNGSVRPMVASRGPAGYTGVDIVAAPGVDQVVDAKDLVATFGPASFDVVVCTEMLEHADDWRLAIANMATVLRPDGVLVITTRSKGFGYHHPPDHWRYTQAAFAEIIQALELELIVLMDDPEYPGVFCKARKPERHPLSGLLEAADRLLALDPAGITPVKEPLKLLGRPAQPDGCGYYRLWQPFRQLELQSEHWVVIPPPGQHYWTPEEEQVEAFDLLVQQRPAGPVALKLWKRWKGLTRYVYEADDNIFQADSSSLPNLLREDVQQTTKECLALAELVTVSTEPLAEVMRGHGAEQVAVIPNFIHADVLDIPPPRNQTVTLCWAGGANHLQDLMMVQDPINQVLDREQVRWHMLGVDYRPIFHHRGDWTDWCADIWDYYRAIDGDVGVIPLRATPFNDCRSPIKALEYAARGIPVVCSDIPPYREFVVDGVTGYLVRTEEEWVGRLRELIHDEAARREMGANAKKIAATWTIQEGWKHWAQTYEQLCDW
jgi:SAM-dependent methyltransferase